MSNQPEVIQYWEAIAAKAGDKRKWRDLRVQEQHAVITSINMLLQILRIERHQGQ